MSKSLADQNREFLSGIIDNIPDTIFVKDSEGRYLINNRAHLKLLGMDSPKEIIGKTVFDIFPAEYARNFDRDDKAALRTGRGILNREEVMVDKSGRKHWMSTSKIPIQDASGLMVRMVGISRDITEIKTYQEALRKANADLESRVEGRTADLRKAISQLRAKNRQLHLLSKQLASQARMEGELAAARKIQKGMLPGAMPDIPRVRLHGFYQPAFEVGGDYLDYFRTPEGRWAVVIADVCGKGVPAALFMTLLRSAFRMEAAGVRTAKELLCRVNRNMRHNLAESSFVTALCLIIEPQGRSMTYARAGHPPLIRMHASRNGETESITPRGVALGLCPDAEDFALRMEELTLDLISGDRLFLYTDGLIEAMNPDKDCYGTERLARVLGQKRAVDAEAMVQTVVQDVQRFRQGAGMTDDLTLLAITVSD